MPSPSGVRTRVRPARSMEEAQVPTTQLTPTLEADFRGAIAMLNQELRKAKIEEFGNLKQEGMTVKEYKLKFIQLCRYAKEIIPDVRSKIRKFFSELGRHVKKEYKASLLISDIDISGLMVHAQQNEDDKKKDRE
ncbi:uncharacterized protein LOC129883517 [Solanum dulcamara]|uniref:uncharacterized protein LOC129883517 n=1 Tax=Solanum dulcamara TaxID=45834 RepID=UPI00248698CA|nr:uncharacterized protein LOC129883517 [Solanum dulcamara]